MLFTWGILYIIFEMIMQIHGKPIGLNEDIGLNELPTQISLFDALSASGLNEHDKWVPATEGQTVILKCTEDDNGVHQMMWITPAFGIFNSVNKSYELQQHLHQTNYHPHIEVLQSGNLLINDFGREDAGHYKCFTLDDSEDICRVINLGIDDAEFRQLYTHSLYIGGATAGLFLALVLIMQVSCYLMNRYGCKCCCGTYISSKAEKVLRVIKTIEQYKTQQLDRLNKNYNSQVSNINETFSRQMEQLQESYTSQRQSLKSLSQYSNHQLQQLKDQYNEQCSKVGEYSMRQLNKVHTNYMEQQDRVCRYTSKQLEHITNSYKYQQKTFNKIVDNIPDLNIKSCLYMDANKFEMKNLYMDPNKFDMKSLYMDPNKFDMKNTSNSTSINIGRNYTISTLPDIPYDTSNNGMGSPDMFNHSEILNILPVTLRQTTKKKCNKVPSLPFDYSSQSKQDDQATTEMILPGLIQEDKYNVGEKNGKKEVSTLSMVKHNKMISFGPLL